MTEQTATPVRGMMQTAGTLELNVARDVVPPFLREATRLAQSGHTEEACLLLEETRLEEIWRLAREDAARAACLALIVGNIYTKAERAQEAIFWLKRAVTGRPTTLILNVLADVLQSTGHLTETLRYRRQALDLAPDDPLVRGGYADTLIKLGRVTEGVAQLQTLIEGDADCYMAHSSLLWFLHYLPDQDPQAVKTAHLAWGARYAPVTLARRTHANDRDTERRLRIGYLSADFRRHSVAYNFEPFLAGRQPDAVEVFGYANVARPDEMTRRLQSRFDQYRSIYGVGDAAAARQIEADRIDILVHLGGHSGGHRLGVMAHKPAPIQVDYGGIATCGMPQIDYRLTDRLLDPEGTEDRYLEGLAYLPGGLVCYAPPDDAPPVGPLPLGHQGYVTFGSFNHHNKINETVLALWARILQQSDDGHLVIKNLACQDPEVQSAYRRFFRTRGIEEDRIHLYGPLDRYHHLDLYNRIDIALDTFPFNGCITTLEALWMGVPVVSLCQQTYVSRVGLTLLHRLDLAFFVTEDAETYASKAYALSQKTEALATLRASMRARMRASPLCDAGRLAREAEGCYRRMWREWCSVKG